TNASLLQSLKEPVRALPFLDRPPLMIGEAIQNCLASDPDSKPRATRCHVRSGSRRPLWRSSDAVFHRPMGNLPARVFLSAAPKERRCSVTLSLIFCSKKLTIFRRCWSKHFCFSKIAISTAPPLLGRTPPSNGTDY